MPEESFARNFRRPARTNAVQPSKKVFEHFPADSGKTGNAEEHLPIDVEQLTNDEEQTPPADELPAFDAEQTPTDHEQLANDAELPPSDAEQLASAQKHLTKVPEHLPVVRDKFQKCQ